MDISVIGGQGPVPQDKDAATDELAASKAAYLIPATGGQEKSIKINSLDEF